MLTRRSFWLPAAIAIVVAAVVIAPLFRQDITQSIGPSGLAGSAAPVFSLRDDRGRAVTLAAYRGHVVVLNLWASWCPPCRAEMPDLQRLQDHYAAVGLVVVGINQGESARRAAQFARALHIAFPIWIDERQQYGRVFAALGLPTTVVIGRDGIVVRGYDGALTLDQMRESVAPALRKS